MDIWQIIIAYGAVQGLVLCLALLFDKRMEPDRKYFLLGLLLCMSFLSADYSITNFYLINGLGVCPVIGLSGAFWLGIGPLFYMSVKSFLGKKTKSPKWALWHLSPLFFSIIVNLPFIFFPAAERQAYLLEYSFTGEAGIMHWLLKSIYHLQILVYPVLLFRELKKNKVPKRSAAYFLTAGLLLLGIVSFAHLLAFNVFHLPFSWFTSNVVFISLTLFIQTLAILSISRPEWIFEPIKKAAKKYANSNLSKLNIPQINARLNQLMEQEKIYRNPDLNLALLAKHLSISPHQLSEFLNQENQQAFGEYVNRYRVREAQYLLRQNASRNLTILAVAYEVGFNSNATFYRYFKKYAGQSPTGWMKGEG